MAKKQPNPNDRDIRSNSRFEPSWEEPIDRYHYVDDIYSDSGKNRGKSRNYSQKPPRQKRKMKGWKKALIWIFSILGALIIALLIAVGVLFARLNVEKVDTTVYEMTPPEISHVEVMDDSSVQNVLVIGADSNKDGSEGRSDTMMLVSLNNQTNELKIVSFLRDLYVDIPGYGKDRLNAAYTYGGAGMLMQTIENNFRVNVDSYLETNFSGFESIIDSMGGIDVTMTAAEAQFINEWKKVGAVEGKNHLNGKNALYFARMRKLDSDFGRTTRQRQVVSAMFAKLKSSNPITMYSVAYNLMPNLKTNLSYFGVINFGLGLHENGRSGNAVCSIIRHLLRLHHTGGRHGARAVSRAKYRPAARLPVRITTAILLETKQNDTLNLE